MINHWTNLNWPSHVNTLSWRSFKLINPNKCTLPESLINEEIDYVFSFFKKIKSFEILRREAIFTLSSLSSSYTRLDYRRNAFNIANDSLHIALQKGVSDFSKIALFSFYTALKFDVRKLVKSFNKQSHNFLTRSKFKNRRYLCRATIQEHFRKVSAKSSERWLLTNLKSACNYGISYFRDTDEKSFPQSVRFNYVLTDNSKDRLTVTMASMTIYI